MLELSDVHARTLGSAPAREQGGVGTEPVVRIRTLWCVARLPLLEAFAWLIVQAVFSFKISLSKLYYSPITSNFFASCMEH